jgi:hypothetical protein
MNLGNLRKIWQTVYNWIKTSEKKSAKLYITQLKLMKKIFQTVSNPLEKSFVLLCNEFGKLSEKSAKQYNSI